MNIIKCKNIPDESQIHNNMKSIDYFDSYMVIKETQDSIQKITERIFTLPIWVKTLLNLRYYVFVKPLGLKTGKKEENNIEKKRNDVYRNNFGSISIVSSNSNEIIMGDNDKHLDYRISIYKQNDGIFTKIVLTTFVKFNNKLGKTYFAIIRPFHKLVVNSLLKKA